MTLRLTAAQDVFTVGSRVHSLVLGMDRGWTNISLSTAELEVGSEKTRRTCLCMPHLLLHALPIALWCTSHSCCMLHLPLHVPATHPVVLLS